MTIYGYIFIYTLIGLAASVLIFWMIYGSKNRRFSKVANIQSSNIKFALSNREQTEYIESANRCKKNNSPVTTKPFYELSIEGTDLLQKESFVLNDDILEGCGYRVR